MTSRVLVFSLRFEETKLRVPKKFVKKHSLRSAVGGQLYFEGSFRAPELVAPKTAVLESWRNKLGIAYVAPRRA